MFPQAIREPDVGSDSPSLKFKVQIRGEALPDLCARDEKVLLALEKGAQTSVRVGCRQGGCGACRVRVISGRYTTDKMSRAHVSEAERAEGYALSCRLYPQSDLVIEAAFVDPRERRRKNNEKAKV